MRHSGTGWVELLGAGLVFKPTPDRCCPKRLISLLHGRELRSTPAPHDGRATKYQRHRNDNHTEFGAITYFIYINEQWDPNDNGSIHISEGDATNGSSSKENIEETGQCFIERTRGFALQEKDRCTGST